MIWGLFYIFAAIFAVACAVQLAVKIGFKKSLVELRGW